jgi:hypothetical protein
MYNYLYMKKKKCIITKSLFGIVLGTGAFIVKIAFEKKFHFQVFFKSMLWHFLEQKSKRTTF